MHYWDEQNFAWTVNVWFCAIVCLMCWIVPCTELVWHARVCVFVGPRAEWQAASGISAMALSHDAASLNAIAANSAAASRAWVHDKPGRSDMEVSCVCPSLW